MASFAKFVQAIDMGKVPETDISVATHDEALQLKELVATHGLSIPDKHTHGLVQEYIPLHTGAWKVAVALPLQGELPKQGPQPHVVSTEAG